MRYIRITATQQQLCAADMFCVCGTTVLLCVRQNTTRLQHTIYCNQAVLESTVHKHLLLKGVMCTVRIDVLASWQNHDCSVVCLWVNTSSALCIMCGVYDVYSDIQMQSEAGRTTAYRGGCGEPQFLYRTQYRLHPRQNKSQRISFKEELVYYNLSQFSIFN